MSDHLGLSEASPVTRWESLMRSYPRDGWDGAAVVIAEHDQKVRELERQMDREIPGWRVGDLAFRPRTERKSAKMIEGIK